MNSKYQIQIVSYNILASHLNSHKYNLVKKKYLDNDYRIKLLSLKLKKLLNSNKKNTIICLQEVGTLQLSFLYTFFIKYNYACVNFKDLAIFYPNNLNVISIEVDYIRSLANKYLKHKNTLIEEVNNFSNPYIIIQLKSKYFKEVTICTTHITSNPKYDDIKILQSYLLAKKLEKFKRVVFCGDFNSMPNSKVYELLSKGSVKLKDYVNIKIKRNFNSCYKLLYNDEINITTHASNLFTQKFTETIDYIWITSDLTPISSSNIVTRKEIDRLDFMPNKLEPSDHFYLSVKLI